MIREKLKTTYIPNEAKDIENLEIDDLFTYYQKNEPMCGLLWTEAGIKLLISW